MAWRIDYTAIENLARITCEGPVTTDEVFAQAKEAVELILRTSASGAMVDYSKAILEMPIAGIYKLPDLFDAMGLPRQTKIAIVLPADPANMHKYTFFDDVANSRGYLVQLYWDTTHAMAWLAKPSESEPSSPPL